MQVLPCSRLRVFFRVGVGALTHLKQCESKFDRPVQECLHAVSELPGALHSLPRAVRCGERPLVSGGVDDLALLVPVSERVGVAVPLLLVYAVEVWVGAGQTIESAFLQYPSHLSEHRARVRDEVQRVPVPDDVESGLAEHGQIAHVSLHCLYLQAVVVSGNAVPLELLFRQVYARDVRSKQSEGRRLLASARREAQDVESARVADEAVGIYQIPRHVFIQLKVRSRVLYAGARQIVPTLLIESCQIVQWHIHRLAILSVTQLMSRRYR